MYLWAARRGLHPLASLASGILLMFSGSFYLHIFAGHMGNLFAMAWVPLLFLAVDAILDRPSTGRVAGGAVVAAMQILTCQYQYVYYTALAAFLYVVLHIRFAPGGGRWKALAALCGIPVGAVALSAFHLFPSLAAGAESVRSAGVSYEFAAMFSLPPENLLTLVIPFFFGDMTSIPYWGRCYLWEMCLFTGAAGLVLAVCGAVCGGKDKKRHALPMVLVMAVLALGVHTPLFSLLYGGLPGFSSFRGTSKFAFQAVVFLALLSGVGLDGLIRRRAFPRAGILLVCLAGLGLLASSLWLFHSSSNGAVDGPWTRLVLGIAGTGESYLPAALYRDPAYVAQAAGFAARSVLAAAMVLLVTALLLRIARRIPGRLSPPVLVALEDCLCLDQPSRVSLPGDAHPAAPGILCPDRDTGCSTGCSQLGPCRREPGQLGYGRWPETYPIHGRHAGVNPDRRRPTCPCTCTIALDLLASAYPASGRRRNGRPGVETASEGPAGRTGRRRDAKRGARAPVGSSLISGKPWSWRRPVSRGFIPACREFAPSG
jgi:hypothetical protein